MLTVLTVGITAIGLLAGVSKCVKPNEASHASPRLTPLGGFLFLLIVLLTLAHGIFAERQEESEEMAAEEFRKEMAVERGKSSDLQEKILAQQMKLQELQAWNENVTNVAIKFGEESGVLFGRSVLKTEFAHGHGGGGPRELSMPSLNKVGIQLSKSYSHAWERLSQFGIHHLTGRGEYDLGEQLAQLLSGKPCELGSRAGEEYIRVPVLPQNQDDWRAMAQIALPMMESSLNSAISKERQKLLNLLSNQPLQTDASRR